MKILVTGGIGYIGSHTCVELLKEDNEIVIIDNLSNSNIDVINRLEKITSKKIKLYVEDLLNKSAIDKIFDENKFDLVMNFAGVKAVGESVKDPLKYYMNNVVTTVNLLDIMRKHNVKKFIFSSTATVYGVPETIPITEDAKVGNTTNPYSTTKYMVETILKDLYKSDNSWSIAILRYFNPIGAHESGLIGEAPNGIPNNLMPYILKVAGNELPYLNVFGNDYNTHDGTGVRSYIHVVDLAKGHVKAIKKLNEKNDVYIYNLGTGIGYSVLDIVNNFEKVNNIKIDYKITERRPGDIDEYFSNPEKAKNELGWVAEKNIEDMCRDSWNWQKNNK